MPEVLTREWLDALRAHLASLDPVDSPERLALGQLVTGAPGGEVAYTLLVGGGERAELRDGLDAATVTVVATYEAARAIATGSSASELLSAGRLKVRGDAGALLRAQDLLAAIGPALARLSGPEG